MTNFLQGNPKAGFFSFVAFVFGWSTLTILCAYLINNVLTNWFDWPGADTILSTDGVTAKSAFQALLYGVGLIGVIVMAIVSNFGAFRHNAKRISEGNAFVIRAAFWAVFFVGIADATISFMRVEDFIEVFWGEQLASDLGKSRFRGPYVHAPMMVAGIVVAMFTRTLGFIWLALLVLIAELIIVFSRFIFSYEQPLMADLVRFWYAALFLFASAYTLLEDSHVRVDLLFASLSRRSKGVSNAIGAILFGMVFCWTIILLGMAGSSSAINGPILVFEITQAGFGMYVKYIMAGFLGFFAVTMLIQFVAMFFEAIADILGEPGERPARQAIT